MPTYRVLKLERKITVTKKPYISATLLDSEGNEHERITIWSDFPGFHGIDEGADIMGELASNGKYTNLKPTRGGYSGGSTTPRSPSYGVKAAQERKGTMIEEAQDRKELSMRLQGAQRDATLITIASLKEQPFPTDEEFKKDWKKWFDFLMGQYDSEKKAQDKPF